MAHLTYVFGEPGIGKSTLVDALTRGMKYEDMDKPFAHRLYDNGVHALGRIREHFPGTDTLPMNAQPMVLTWLQYSHPEYVLGEGDRLTNQSFFAETERLGYELHLYYLQGPALAATRRDARESHQNPVWLKGRQTKVQRIAAALPVTIITPSLPPPVLARLMADPVSMRFRR